MVTEAGTAGITEEVGTEEVGTEDSTAHTDSDHGTLILTRTLIPITSYPYDAYPAYPSDAPAVPSEPQQTYWYYCKEAQAYYPYVTSCPGGWVPVVPKPPEAGKEAVPQ